MIFALLITITFGAVCIAVGRATAPAPLPRTREELLDVLHRADADRRAAALFSLVHAAVQQQRLEPHIIEFLCAALRIP